MKTKRHAVIFFNEHPVGSQVTYWPYGKHLNGKRTRTRSEAFLSHSGVPVVYLEAIPGYVHIGHVEFGSPMPVDSPCFDSEFRHKWPVDLSGPVKETKLCTEIRSEVDKHFGI